MENNTYRIEFYNMTNEGDDKKVVATNNQNAGEEQATTESVGKRKKPTKVLAAISYARNVADRVITSKINIASLRTGYEEKQQREQFYFGIGKKVIDTGMAIGVGAMFGGLPGALVGMTLSVTSEMLNLSLKQNELNMAREQENISIFFNQIRMGAGRNREGRTQ